ncbi:hypothetical protein B566_EDAN005151 [Ephemera danica]|nr:hypothetical protein B566_EDAN005151 [Ephemera danica]
MPAASVSVKFYNYGAPHCACNKGGFLSLHPGGQLLCRRENIGLITLTEEATTTQDLTCLRRKCVYYGAGSSDIAMQTRKSSSVINCMKEQIISFPKDVSHTTDDLVFVWDPLVPLVVDERIELPQLDIVNNATGDCTQLYSTGNFTCLEVSFTLRRRLGYYLFHTYVPTCLIVIMSWISFWIKPEAVPARVTLGVTSLLTLSTQHANSQKSLPPVSYIKASSPQFAYIVDKNLKFQAFSTM